MQNDYHSQSAAIMVSILVSLAFAAPGVAQELNPRRADKTGFRADEALATLKQEVASLPKPNSRNLPLLFAANLVAPGLIPGYDFSGLTMTTSNGVPQVADRRQSVTFGLLALAADGLTVFGVQQALATRQPQYWMLASAAIVHPMMLMGALRNASKQDDEAILAYKFRLVDLTAQVRDLELLDRVIEQVLAKAQTEVQAGNWEKAREVLEHLEGEAADDQRVETLKARIDAEAHSQEVQRLLDKLAAIEANRSLGAEHALAEADALLKRASEPVGQDERIKQAILPLHRASREAQERRDQEILAEATAFVGRTYFRAAESLLAKVTPGAHASEIAALRKKIELGRQQEREAQARAQAAREHARMAALQTQLAKRGLSRWFPQRVGTVWSYISGSASRLGGLMESLEIDRIESVNSKLCLILRSDSTSDEQIVFSSASGIQRLGVIRTGEDGKRHNLLYSRPETELPSNARPGTRWQYKSQTRTVLRELRSPAGHEFLVVSESGNVQSILVYQRGVGLVYGETYGPPPWGTAITRLSHLDGRSVDLPYLGLEYQ